ncbi:MAG: sigma-70 family RNA polymerase sigma factor [Myxococcota bacterium]|nr:sigma-70 family RNA polymerase sigma factor [Myxococcota bacterium]MDW8361281.1 sigma-70 family RNA polymerase sigma factor [Myxococcales bacterium]
MAREGRRQVTEASARAGAVPLSSLVNDSAGKASNRVDGPDADRLLVDAARRGDERAFRALFERHYRRVFTVACGVLRNRHDAEDVVQEAFVRIHRHLDAFEGRSSFYTWLYRTVMNLAIDHLRRTRRTRELDYDDGLGVHLADAEGAVVPLAPIPEADPLRTVERRRLREAIDEALDELPPYHRAVIVLRELEGMSYEQIAEVLSIPKGTVMSRLFHARRKMQQRLRAYVEVELTVEE